MKNKNHKKLHENTTIEQQSNQVGSKRSIQFPNGIYGFQNHIQFLLEVNRVNNIFYSLHSTQDSNLSFLIINPKIILWNYTPKIYKSHLETIRNPSIKDVEIWTLVTIPANQPEKMTINLQGPIIINTENNLGMQTISEDENHVLKYSIFENLKKLNQNKK